MAKTENKTKPTGQSVEAFIAAVENGQRRQDAEQLAAMMERITGEAPKLWGASIIGFGDAHYKYESGREGDWFKVGFSPRKASLVLYIMPGFNEYGALMERLGKFKTGKACLYINKLADIDMAVLGELVARSIEREHWGSGWN